jgi:hypothetical protein
MKITLEFPIERKGQEPITQVEVTKPGTGHLRGIKLIDVMQMDVSAILAILPRVTVPPVDPADLAKLDPADLMQLGVAVSSFFGKRAEREAVQADLA